MIITEKLQIIADNEQRVYDAGYTEGANSVNLDDYVKNTDYATTDTAGIVKINNASGIRIDNNKCLMLDNPNENEIKNKANINAPLKPRNIDLAVKVGITTNTIALTDEEKAAALAWLGALPQNTLPGSHIYASASLADGTINQVMLPYGTGIYAGRIVMRGSKGEVPTPTPTADEHAVNKKYVDDIIADLVARVEALERGGLTGDISFTIDNTTYYADEGMMWGEWCNSRYNTLGLFVNEAQGGAISSDNHTLHMDSGSYVLWGDTIENGFDYYLTI